MVDAAKKSLGKGCTTGFLVTGMCTHSTELGAYSSQLLLSPLMTMVDQILCNNEETDSEKRLADAKEARKRAKEKARSMHAQIFNKKDEKLKGNFPIQASTTSHRTRVASMSSRPIVATATNKKKRPTVNGNGSVGNFSIGSISELDAIVTFNDSGHMNMSSISHMSGSSYDSLQKSFSGGVPIIQGASRFESTGSEQRASVTDAPKMPRRGSSDRDLPFWHDSNTSLSLDDIIEEDSSHSGHATDEPGRCWKEGTTVGSHGVKMPIRAESFANRDESESSFASDSASSVALSAESSTGISFYSSV